MIHIALKTEYSFKRTFGHLERIVDQAAERGDTALGIADINNTYGHVKFQKLCKSRGIKPIFGVRLNAVDETEQNRSPTKTYNQIVEIIFIAKNNEGLSELYKLVNTAYDQFYYFPRITFDQAASTSENLVVIAPRVPPGRLFLAARIDYTGLSAYTLSYPISPDNSGLKSPPITVLDNQYPNLEDKFVYQLMSSPKTETQTYYQHILNEQELIENGFPPESISATHELAEQCNAELQIAEMVKYKGSETIFNECIRGALRNDIDLDEPVYKARLERELKLIEEKGYGDYFLIVADMIKEAKKKMMVGPGRGSSAGSLVCYLMGITEIDPIKYDLLFERFIDINRADLPDIDTDFADHKRQDVIKYLAKKYGKDNVRCIGTISTMKPKVAINEFAKAIGIPTYDTDDVKNAIIERSGGDARAQMCIMDTLQGTDAGKRFIEKHPNMKIVSEIEGHARHSGKHAAGVIVCNDPLYYYAGIDSRDNVVMVDKKDAEAVGLLKIDALGLRTLSILEETAKLAGFNYKEYYSLPLDDQKVFDIFNDNRMYGIFQFEGQALQILVKQMGVNSFMDIAAITSLARPGALNSGGAARYVKYHTGKDEPEYFDEDHKKITEETYSTVVYQEQMMQVARVIGGLSWEDVSDLRKAASKSLGDEYFGKYRDKFIAGAKELKGYDQEKAERIWKDISSSGSWSFNKSHAVSYSLISYWTAWSKAYYPLEFAAANLNHAKDDESAIRILRDFVVNDGIEYVAVDPDESDVQWTIKDGKLLGGLTNFHGIGIKKAQKILSDRSKGKVPTPAIAKLFFECKTKFDIIFPADHYWGHLYKEPMRFNIPSNLRFINQVHEPGEYTIIGRVIERDLRDRNDYQSVVKRGHEVDKDQFYLNLYVQDDTDSIKCTIPPYAFENLEGQKIAETSVVNETWYCIHGKVRDNWRSISVDYIANLMDIFPDVARQIRLDK